MRECPCFDGGDCERRHKDCHAKCKEYKDWRKEADGEKILKQSKDGEYLSYIVPKINKRRKRKNEKSGA